MENTNETPIIAPRLLLVVTAASLLVALAVAFTQATFSVVGWIAIVVAILSFVGWIILDPKSFLDIVRGRTVAFGGTSILVTVLLIGAMIAIYTVIRGADLRYDFTQKDAFSLSENSRQAISAFSADPNLPATKIIGFYDITQAGSKDRDTVLLDAYVEAGNGKISYEFLDYDRYTLLAEQYQVTSPGGVAVAPVKADGEPDVDKAQLLPRLEQETLTNAILRVAASGDFRAYFLSVENGQQLDDTEAKGLSELNSWLKDRYNWTVQQVSGVDLVSGKVKLDEATDGTVLVIPGGSAALTDETADFIKNYLNSGGDAIIMADFPSTADEPALATAENMNSYFAENYSISFSPDMVIDEENAFVSPDSPVALVIEETHPITSAFYEYPIVFEQTQHLIISDNTPENITVTPLVSSGESAFTKTIEQLLNREASKTETDPVGPFILAAAAENTATESKVVFIGRPSIANNTSHSLTVSLQGMANFNLILTSLVWTTGFEEFFTDIPQVSQVFRLQDTPIFADAQMLSTINLVTLALPFAILGLGLLVWYVRRERAFKES